MQNTSWRGLKTHSFTNYYAIANIFYHFHELLLLPWEPAINLNSLFIIIPKLSQCEGDAVTIITDNRSNKCGGHGPDPARHLILQNVSKGSFLEGSLLLATYATYSEHADLWEMTSCSRLLPLSEISTAGQRPGSQQTHYIARQELGFQIIRNRRQIQHCALGFHERINTGFRLTTWCGVILMNSDWQQLRNTFTHTSWHIAPSNQSPPGVRHWHIIQVTLLLFKSNKVNYFRINNSCKNNNWNENTR